MRRLVVVLVCLGLVAGDGSLCAGWAATPQARMACCADGGGCPMHAADAAHSDEHGALDQLQADTCCASSESHSSPSSVSVVAVTWVAASSYVLLPPSIPARVLPDGWRTAAPGPIPPIPRHVLLSVFLI